MISLAWWLSIAALATSTQGSIVAGGVTRTYVLYVPSKAPPRPALILAFHGHGGDGAGQERLSGLDRLADRDGFIVVYPDGLTAPHTRWPGWNDGRRQNGGADDLAFARALVADLTKRYRVDRKRIYATGFSNGGTFTEYLGCKMTGVFAAIAPVSGSIPVADRASCAPSRAIPVLEIAGTADPIMPYDGGEIRLLGVDRGEVTSAPGTAAFWAGNDYCNLTPHVQTLPSSVPADGTSVRLETYGACSAGTTVELYTIVSGGHTWPGGRQYLPKAFVGIASNQLDASRTIVDFFLAHSK